jgi:hypothetical protein
LRRGWSGSGAGGTGPGWCGQLLLDDAARQRFFLLQGDYTSKLLEFIDRGELPSTLGGERDVTAWLLEQRRRAAEPGGDGLRHEAEAELRRRQVDLADRQLADLELALSPEADGAGGGPLEYGGRVATEEEVMAVAAVRLNVAQLSGEELGRMGRWMRELDSREILRFLRAQPGGDPALAWENLRETALWRAAEGLDGPAPADGPAFEPGQEEVLLLPPDRLGRPVVVYRSALHVPGKIDHDDYARRVVRVVEAARRRYGLGTRTQACLVVDRVGSGLGNQDPGLLRVLVPLLRRHYPGLVGALYVAPVNPVFYVVWAIASLLLDAETRDSVRLLGGDYAPALLEVRPGAQCGSGLRAGSAGGQCGLAGSAGG